MALTEKQGDFCRQYLVDLNATQAAIRAGYSAKHAHRIANTLMGKSLVKAEIAKLMARRSQKTEVKAEQVIRELCRIAFSDIRKVVTWSSDGVSILPPEEIDSETAGAIAEVSQSQHGLKVKLHSKSVALGKLAQHLGILLDGKVLSDLQKQVAELMNARPSGEA